MKRREFLLLALGMKASVFLEQCKKPANSSKKKKMLQQLSEKDMTTQQIFSQIMIRAQKSYCASLPIGECMGEIAMALLGTPYVDGTLEGEGAEVCRADLTGLDCVTFYENVLCSARILKKGYISFEDFIEEITFTRYRNGKLTDYTSRLHYVADWIYDNEQKKVVENITREMGGEEYPFEVSFMSTHPQSYPAFKEFPEFIEEIAEIEKEINSRTYWYIPQSKIKGIQKSLKTGDIIAFATARKGLDYNHTGLAYRDGSGKLRLLHASQRKRKVYLDEELCKYVESVESHIGITVVRPLEIKNTQA